MKKSTLWIKEHITFKRSETEKTMGMKFFEKKKIKDENLKKGTENSKFSRFCLKGQCRETCNSFKSQDQVIPSTTRVQTPLTTSLKVLQSTTRKV